MVAQTEMMPVRRSDVCGVPALWVDSGRPTVAASLMFRAGVVDEVLAQRGWTHLWEHLAMRGERPRTVDANGSVGMLHTSFDLAGTPEQVTDALNDIVRRLNRSASDVDPREVEAERGVLTSEAHASNRCGAMDAALWRRYHAAGPGLLASVEAGIDSVTSSDLAIFASNRFLRGNAVLCLDGPPPAGLRLDLPDGYAPTPLMPLRPNETAPSPGRYVHDAPSILFNALLPADTRAAECFLTLWRAQAVAELDPDRVDVVGAQLHAARVTPTKTLWGLDVAAPRAMTDKAVRAATTILDRLASEGPDARKLSDLIEWLDRSDAKPGMDRDWPWRMGSDMLLGAQPKSWSQWHDELADITPRTIQSVAAMFAADMFVGLSAAASGHGGVARARTPSSPVWMSGPIAGANIFNRAANTATEPKPSPAIAALPESEFPFGTPATGTSYRRPFGAGDPDGSRLVVGETEISCEYPERIITMRWAEMATVMAWPSGRRDLVDRDGQILYINPPDWRHGDRLTAIIDAKTPGVARLPRPDDKPKRRRFPLRFLTELTRPHSGWRLTWMLVSAIIIGLVLSILAIFGAVWVEDNAPAFNGLATIVVSLVTGVWFVGALFYGGTGLYTLSYRRRRRRRAQRRRDQVRKAMV